MSRQGHLPPRYPIQKKTSAHLVHDTISPLSVGSNSGRHHKCPSQSSVLEEQPAWLDDLLSDPDAGSKAGNLRRSVSDPVVLMEHIMDSFSSLDPPSKDEETPTADETVKELDSACHYGPNSPRRRNNSSIAENAIVSAFSECVPPNPNQYSDKTVRGASATHSSSADNGRGFFNMYQPETMTAKRHPGQRSRVRKLQYIAELERMVNIWQTLESDLSGKVSSLGQKHIVLSVENSQLKQQLIRLKQKKLIVEGEYQSLAKEAERLRLNIAKGGTRKIRAYHGSDAGAMNWELEMTKLNLNI